MMASRDGRRGMTTIPILIAAGCILTGASRAWADTGLIPLSDLGVGTYMGFEGGLYPGGRSLPPPSHRQAALAAARNIRPLDATGNPDPGGWIGLLSIGMSNTNQEFKVFERDADISPWRHARVVIVNGAVGGQAAEIIASPGAPYWSIVDERLATAGLTPAQIQAVWLKEANAQPISTSFPAHALALENDLADIVRILKARFVNLRICFLSSRIYGGYSSNPLRGEPLSYETGFSVKWLIEDQIDGSPGLNHDPAGGTVVAPVLLWGPYLWADGATPRSDGLTWLPADFEADNVHPSSPGEKKVGALLSLHFAVDPAANPWYAARPDSTILAVDAAADATIDAEFPGTNFGSAPDLLTRGTALPAHALILTDSSAVSSQLLRAKLGVRCESSTAGSLRLSSDTTWQESSVTFGTAPAPDATVGSTAAWSRDGALGIDVTAGIAADDDGRMTFIMTRDAPQPAFHLSRETGEPPRLTLSVAVPPVFLEVTPAPDPDGTALRWTDAGTGLYHIRRARGPRPDQMHAAQDVTVTSTTFPDPDIPAAGEFLFYLVQPGGLLAVP